MEVQSKLRNAIDANGEVGHLTTAGAITCEVERAENDQYGNRWSLGGNGSFAGSV